MNVIKIFNQFIDSLPITKKVGEKRVKWGLAAIAGLILLFSILSSFSSGSAEADTNWALVNQGDFDVCLVEAGDVEAESSISINAPMMWGAKLQVIDVVPEGTIVEQGDFLLQFDVSDLEDQKKLREDQLASLQADLVKLKAQQALTIYNQEQSLQLAEYSYEQAKLRLEMRKFESQAQQEEARLELKQAEIERDKLQKQLNSQKIIHRSQIIQRQTGIRESENRVKSTIDRISRLQILSPASGMVVYQQVRGERVKEGYESRPGWPLMYIPDLSSMVIKVFINEVDRLKVKVGLQAEITLEAYPDLNFTGRVRNISRLAQVVTGEERLKGFVAYVEVNGTDPRMKPGITAQVKIILDTLTEVTYVPVGCVFEKEGQPVVYRSGSDRPIAVYLGPRNDSHVVIEGVRPDMRLSYTVPTDESMMLGGAEERRRVDEIGKTLRESFAVFQDKGILHDYGVASESQSTEESSTKTAIDIDKLPASIRERLRAQGQSTQSAPKVEVGETEGRRRQGTFKISPEMAKRLEQRKSQQSQQESTSQKKN